MLLLFVDNARDQQAPSVAASLCVTVAVAHVVAVVVRVRVFLALVWLFVVEQVELACRPAASHNNFGLVVLLLLLLLLLLLYSWLSMMMMRMMMLTFELELFEKLVKARLALALLLRLGIVSMLAISAIVKRCHSCSAC